MVFLGMILDMCTILIIQMMIIRRTLPRRVL